MTRDGRAIALKALFTAWLLAAAGCVTARIAPPVATFQEVTATSAEALSAYYRGLNAFERDLYLEARLYDPKLTVAASEGGRPTPLAGNVFSPESIRARLDAVHLVGAYAQRLSDLATSDEPQRVEEGVKRLGERLGKVDGTFAKLADASAARYAGPVSQLLGALASMYVEEKRDAAVRAAVVQGAPAVGEVLDLLERDFAELLGSARRLGLKESMATRVAYYNEVRLSPALVSAGGFDLRRRLLADINTSALRYDEFVTAQPAELVRAIRDAHAVLLEAARARRRTPDSIAAVPAAMSTYKTRVASIAAAIREIADRKE
jgi:hypothetical protein